MSTMTVTRHSISNRFTGLADLAGHIALYAGVLFAMSRWGAFDPSDALGVAAILGVGFSLTAWALTIGTGVGGFFQPAVSNDVVYAGAFTNGQGHIYAIDAGNGGLLWQAQLPVSGNARLTPPAVANGVLYVGSADYNDDSDGYPYALDTNTGAVLWNFNTAGGIYSSAAVADGVVYFGSDDMNVYSLDAGTGTRLWNYTTGDKVLCSPAVVNGMLYVGSEDMYMYAFHLAGSN